MNWLYLIIIISDYAFVFGMLNLISCLFKNTNNNSAMFICAVISVFISHTINVKYKNKIKYVPLLLFIIPVFFLKNTEAAIILAASLIYSIFYINKNIEDKDYINYCDTFGKQFYIILAVIFICILDINSEMKKSSIIMPYLILYLVLGVIIMRTLRNIESGIMNDKISSITFKYVSIAVIVSIIAASLNIKKYLSLSYNKLIDLLTNNPVFENIFLLVGNIVNFITNTILAAIAAVYGKMNADQKVKSKETKVQQIIQKDTLFQNKYFILAFKILLAVILLYILIKVMQKNFKSSKDNKEYTEESEFIIPKHNILKNIKNKIITSLKPKNYNDNIRLYYKKYLKMCTDNNVKINESDTSYDVKEKSNCIFDNNIISNIRNTYISIRYGSFNCDKQTYENFKQTYEKLNRK